MPALFDEGGQFDPAAESASNQRVHLVLVAYVCRDGREPGPPPCVKALAETIERAALQVDSDNGPAVVEQPIDEREPDSSVRSGDDRGIDGHGFVPIDSASSGFPRRGR